MLTIEEVIGNLLLRHNCVVIPTFGGFVAKQVSAQIDYASGLMFPPKKSLLFNRQLINNDGLLISEFAKNEGLTFEAAEFAVKQKISDWNQSLKSGERISIDKVGYLFFDQEKNICFEQDRFFNLLLSSYGLGKVHFLSDTEVTLAQHEAKIHPIKAAEVQSIVPKMIVVEPNVAETISPESNSKIIAIHPVKEGKSHRKAWKYIAAACLLPIAFYSIWIPMKTDVLESGVVSLKDFNPFQTEVQPLYKMNSLQITPHLKNEVKSLEKQLEEVQSDTKTYQYNFSNELYVTVKVGEAEAINNELDVQPEAKVITPMNSVKQSMNYIVGCFSDESNANNLVSTLKSEGLNAHIVDVKNGLHRVSAGGASNENDFAKIISLSESKGFQGWVLQ